MITMVKRIIGEMFRSNQLTYSMLALYVVVFWSTAAFTAWLFLRQLAEYGW